MIQYLSDIMSVEFWGETGSGNATESKEPDELFPVDLKQHS